MDASCVKNCESTIIFLYWYLTTSQLLLFQAECPVRTLSSALFILCALLPPFGAQYQTLSSACLFSLYFVPTSSHVAAIVKFLL